MKALQRSVVLTVVLVVLCGVLYPLAGWGVSQAAFSHQADGSLAANGSVLIGQPWSSAEGINPRWFNGRPDADNPLGLNAPSGTLNDAAGLGLQAGSSGAANLGPRSTVLVGSVERYLAAWRKVGVEDPTPDLVTTSASGIDPDLAPADAYVQVAMVAKARHLAPAVLDRLVASQVHGAQFGFLGAPYVNVLELNEALARLAH